MIRIPLVPLLLATALLASAGCNSILGIDDHQLAPEGGTGSLSGSTDGSIGSSSGASSGTSSGGSGGSSDASGSGGGSGSSSTGSSSGASSGTSSGGSGGSSGASGSGGGSGSSSSGSSSGGGSGSSSGGSSSGGGSGGSSSGASAGGSGDASVGGAEPITKVVKTAGCGLDPGQAAGMTVRGTIQTMGTKPAGCADSVCGPWSYLREYFVTLPTGYVNTKAYPLVLEGPGCGGGGMNVYPLSNPDPNVNNTVIRVGLTPPPNAIGHATNPGQGCFDDREGDSSVDWVFYENLYDKLAGALCFDKNRVFASGNSTGGSFSNELGCKYAGDPTRPVRGIMPNTGGLPTDPKYVPTCTIKGMAGMWIHDTNDTTNPFIGNKVAIARAMKVNGCAIGTSYDDTMFDNFPIGGGNPDTTCKKIRGCPDLYPLVVCALSGTGHASHDNVANPGFSTFITLFSMPPLLTP